MIDGPLVICADNEVLPPHYITRSISRNIIIEVKFFEKMDEDTTVDVEELLENDEYDEESGRVIYVSDVEGCRKEFDLLCSKVKKPKAHLFAMTEREKLEWVRSTHGVEDLEGFRVEPSSMGESELLRYENNINIVCADSGMGKTELMKSLIRGTKPIVVRYVWDGLNEVSSEHVKVIMKLIRDLSKEGTKNWITSRTNLKQSLENYFGTFSWTISEFDEDQQQTYIQDRLSHLTDSFKISLNSIRLSWCGGVFGIPLLIYILTEFFSMEHSIPDGSCPIGKLYQHLVDQIFNVHYTEKHDYNIHSECQTERNEVTKNKRILNYEKVAMKMYFEGDVVSKMDVDKFLMKIKSESDHVGIITRVVETESPLFLHSSFAEYFAGSYLARYDPHGDKFDLSDRSYKNIRLFRDLLVKQK
ncbi:hypothetical protein MTP99_014359 [Tenebrio molitor]|nr:hypothetical protein MTP99_014359 [Tenebrio molitor]